MNLQYYINLINDIVQDHDNIFPLDEKIRALQCALQEYSKVCPRILSEDVQPNSVYSLPVPDLMDPEFPIPLSIVHKKTQKPIRELPRQEQDSFFFLYPLQTFNTYTISFILPHFILPEQASPPLRDAEALASLSASRIIQSMGQKLINQSLNIGSQAENMNIKHYQEIATKLYQRYFQLLGLNTRSSCYFVTAYKKDESS